MTRTESTAERPGGMDEQPRAPERAPIAAPVRAITGRRSFRIALFASSVYMLEYADASRPRGLRRARGRVLGQPSATAVHTPADERARRGRAAPAAGARRGRTGAPGRDGVVDRRRVELEARTLGVDAGAMGRGAGGR